MCLIITSTAAKVRNTLLTTPGLLEDIYASNSDGLGAMYTTSKGKLRTPKIIANNVDQLTTFIRNLPDDDRQIAYHFRFKTHGDIDLTNCHPYPVIEGKIAMMHNGVLSHGNMADKTKSDTWHYIKNTVRPQLEVAPLLFTLPSWIELIEADISGGNRFVIMDHLGNMTIANKDTGIEHDGMWFSNTYAWSPDLLIPGYRKVGVYRGAQSFDPEDYYGGYTGGWGGYAPRLNPMHSNDVQDRRNLEDPEDEAQTDGMWLDARHISDLVDDIGHVMAEYDVAGLRELILDRPNFTLSTIMSTSEFQCSVDPETEMSPSDAEVALLLEDADYRELARRVINNESFAIKLSEVMCWYGDWYDKGSADTDADIRDEDDTQVAHIAARTNTHLALA